MSTNGTSTKLASYTNSPAPGVSLALHPDGNFYGTTLDLGGFGAGTLVRMSTNGDLETLISFDGTTGSFRKADYCWHLMAASSDDVPRRRQRLRNGVSGENQRTTDSSDIVQ